MQPPLKHNNNHPSRDSPNVLVLIPDGLQEVLKYLQLSDLRGHP